MTSSRKGTLLLCQFERQSELSECNRVRDKRQEAEDEEKVVPLVKQNKKDFHNLS